MKTIRCGACASLLLVGACSSSHDDAPIDDAAAVDSTRSDGAEAGPSETSTADATGGDVAGDGAADGGGDAGELEHCTSEAPSVSPTGAGLTATTTHYELYAEATTAEVTELAQLLEASSGAFATWFERPPPSERMKVKYYKDQPAWAAGLTADGLSVPAGAGGFFSPTTKTAYLYRQGNPYYSHVLAVHEATHQYHRLTRLFDVDAPSWYMEGHAEYLSRHDWDGRCVRLGVTSLLSWEDLPAVAKAEPGIDVAAIVGGTLEGTRADAWSIFRYLDTGPLRPQFKAYRDAFDAGKSPSFASTIAPPASVATSIAAWLPSAQEPMKPVFTEWIHVGPRAVNVDSPVYFTFALVKASPITRFEAKLRVPSSGKWTAGAIVSYTDSTHYVGVVHGDDGDVRTFTASGAATWAKLGTAPKPTGDVELIAVDYGSGVANVTFDGARFAVPVTAPRAGLAASDTTASFYDVGWTP